MNEHFAHVENGEIGHLGALPKNWRNVSGLNKSKNDLSFLKTLGFFPVEYVEKVYNEATHHLGAPTRNIQADKVVFTDNVMAYTELELATNVYNKYIDGWFSLDEEMSREEEDHITEYHGGIASTASRGTVKRKHSDIYAERIAKRADAPAKP